MYMRVGGRLRPATTTWYINSSNILVYNKEKGFFLCVVCTEFKSIFVRSAYTKRDDFERCVCARVTDDDGKKSLVGRCFELYFFGLPIVYSLCALSCVRCHSYVCLRARIYTCMYIYLNAIIYTI